MKIKALLPSLVLISLLISCRNKTNSEKNVATKVYRQNDSLLYIHMASAIADSLYQTAVDKKKFSDCFIDKLKSRFPNGIDSVASDTLLRQQKRIAIDCYDALKITVKVPWDSATKAQVTSAILVSPAIRNWDPSVKKLFCDCYLKQLMLRYPNGLQSVISNKIRKKITTACTEEIVQKTKIIIY